MSDMFEPGQYDATLTKMELSSSGKGIAQVVMTFDIGGHSRRVYQSLSDKAFNFTKVALDKVGFNGDFTDPKFSIPGPHRLECRRETYNGEPTERWGFPDLSSKPKPVAVDVAMQLTARYRASNPTPSPTTTPATAPTTPPAPVPPAPVAPPPPVSAPPAPVSAPFNFPKNDCYAAYLKETNNKPDLQKWGEILADYLRSHGLTEETQITSQGWKDILDLLNTPF